MSARPHPAPAARGPRHGAAAPPAPGEVGGVAVLGERDGLCVVFKPAGVPSEPDRARGLALTDHVAALLGVMPRALHVVTRLDTPVSGAVLLAVAAPGMARAAALLAAGAIERRYLGLVARAPAPPAGTWQSAVPTPRGPRQAATRYAVLAEAGAPAAPGVPGAAPGGVALVEFELETGRFHQIRAHAEAAGVPLLGDVAHGGSRRLVGRGGAVHELSRPHLHAARVAVALGGGQRWTVSAALPADLRASWAAAGGAATALDAAEGRP